MPYPTDEQIRARTHSSGKKPSGRRAGTELSTRSPTPNDGPQAMTEPTPTNLLAERALTTWNGRQRRLLQFCAAVR